MKKEKGTFRLPSLRIGCIFSLGTTVSTNLNKVALVLIGLPNSTTELIFRLPGT